MKLSVFKKAFNKDINIIRVLFVALFVGSIGLSFWISKNKYAETAEVVKVAFKLRDSVIEKAILADTSKSQPITKLREQYFAIAEIKKPYFFMAQRFTSYGYTFTIFFALSSILSGILGFLLIKKGWDSTESFYLKASFLIIFFCSTLFGILPNVFNTKENTKNNLTKYNYFSGLQLDIYDLVKDNHGFIKRNTPGSLDSLNLTISSITKSIKENQDLYFDTYIDKIPTDVKPLK
ncbi:hypothetical protein [Parasediminibacterium sp. JCM 36343]|uniref:hypothetical protein n=1 Tax=Parasediminibacterium sp. JCM 36343 TaxID=3374279 RepID=UPI00397B9E69